MSSKKDKFVEKSIKRHGLKYDYSLVNYLDSTTKVKIICPIHGEFLQTPQAHVRGNGCPLCANKRRGDAFRLSKEELNKLNNSSLDEIDQRVLDLLNKEIIELNHWQNYYPRLSQ